MDVTSLASLSRGRRCLVSLLLALPLLAYVGAMALPVAQRGKFVFGWGDLAVLGVAMLYAAGAGQMLLAGGRLGCFRFLTVTYGALLSLVGLELGLRALVPLPSLPAPHAPMRRSFVVGDTMPGIEGTVEFTVNQLGLRGPQYAEADLKILCVGGSTTECLYVTDKLSWPWLLQERLGEQLGNSVYVGNAGKSGHLSRHHEYLLSHYEPARRFDLVLVLCGYNDLNTLVCADSYEERLPRIAEETLVSAARSDRAGYQRLALFRLALRSVEQKRVGVIAQDFKGNWYAREREGRRRALLQHSLDSPPRHFDRALATYRANLERINEVCRRRGQTLAFITQPTLYRPDLSEELQQLLYNHVGDTAYTAAALAHMMEAFNEAMLEVSRKHEIACLDLARSLPRDTSVFYDDCHFNIAGCRQVAERVAEFVATRAGPGS